MNQVFKSPLAGVLLELVGQAFLVRGIKVTKCYGFLSLDIYVLDEQEFSFMWLRPKVMTRWGSLLFWFSGCWLHSPGGRCSGKKARTYQSRKTRAQLHDGYSADQKSESSPLCLQREHCVFLHIGQDEFCLDL